MVMVKLNASEMFLLHIAYRLLVYLYIVLSMLALSHSMRFRRYGCDACWMSVSYIFMLQVKVTLNSNCIQIQIPKNDTSRQTLVQKGGLRGVSA